MRKATTYSLVLGQIIQAHRKARAVNQEVMALKLGISQSAYSRLERGRSALAVPQLVKLSDVLGLQAAELLKQVQRTKMLLARRGIRVHPDATTTPLGAWLWVNREELAAAVGTAIRAEH